MEYVEEALVQTAEEPVYVNVAVSSIVAMVLPLALQVDVFTAVLVLEREFLWYSVMVDSMVIPLPKSAICADTFSGKDFCGFWQA